jgi:hypothetical protein
MRSFSSQKSLVVTVNHPNGSVKIEASGYSMAEAKELLGALPTLSTPLVSSAERATRAKPLAASTNAIKAIRRSQDVGQANRELAGLGLGVGP